MGVFDPLVCVFLFLFFSYPIFWFYSCFVSIRPFFVCLFFSPIFFFFSFSLSFSFWSLSPLSFSLSLSLSLQILTFILNNYTAFVCVQVHACLCAYVYICVCARACGRYPYIFVCVHGLHMQWLCVCPMYLYPSFISFFAVYCDSTPKFHRPSLPPLLNRL